MIKYGLEITLVRVNHRFQFQTDLKMEIIETASKWQNQSQSKKPLRFIQLKVRNKKHSKSQFKKKVTCVDQWP